MIQCSNNSHSPIKSHHNICKTKSIRNKYTRTNEHFCMFTQNRIYIFTKNYTETLTANIDDPNTLVKGLEYYLLQLHLLHLLHLLNLCNLMLEILHGKSLLC
eukprot:196466_1